MRTIASIVVLLLAIGASAVVIDADGGLIFNRKQRKCDNSDMCDPDMEAFPIDEIEQYRIDSMPAPVDESALPIDESDQTVVGSQPPPETRDTTGVNDLITAIAQRLERLEVIVEANGSACRSAVQIDVDVIVEAVLVRLPQQKPQLRDQPAESPDLSIIVGEVLRQLPPRVAYFEIVPRNSN